MLARDWRIRCNIYVIAIYILCIQEYICYRLCIYDILLELVHRCIDLFKCIYCIHVNKVSTVYIVYNMIVLGIILNDY